MKSYTARQYFTTLTILFLALLISQLIFAAIMYLLVQSNPPQLPDPDETLLYIAPVLAFMMVALSYFLPNTLLQKAKNKPSLYQKLMAYQGISLVRYALLEASSFFSTICYFLTGNSLLLGVTAVIIVIFVINRPSTERISADLALDYNDQITVADPEAIIKP